MSSPSQSYGFSSSHIWMWELDYKENWVPKNWCFWTATLEKTLENPLDGKEIQPVHPKGDQSWVFIGRTDVEAETPILWPPDLFIGKDHDARKWLKVGREGDDREGDGWIAPSTQWTWVWPSSRSWWQTGKPGVLQSMRSQRVRHDWVTKLNWTELKPIFFKINFITAYSTSYYTEQAWLIGCNLALFFTLLLVLICSGGLVLCPPLDGMRTSPFPFLVILR